MKHIPLLILAISFFILASLLWIAHNDASDARIVMDAQQEYIDSFRESICDYYDIYWDIESKMIHPWEELKRMWAGLSRDVLEVIIDENNIVCH